MRVLFAFIAVCISTFVEAQTAYVADAEGRIDLVDCFSNNLEEVFDVGPYDAPGSVVITLDGKTAFV